MKPCETQSAQEYHHHNFKWILVFFWFRFGFFLVFAFFSKNPPLFSFGKSGLSQPKKEDEFKKKVQKPKKTQKKNQNQTKIWTKKWSGEVCWQFGCRTIPKFAQVRPCEAQNAHEDHHYNFKWILVFFWFRFGFFLVFAFF